MTTTPAAAALIDQAHAAANHGAQLFADTAQRVNATVDLTVPTGARAAILNRLSQMSFSGQVTGCPHLRPTSPQPQFWAAWKPGRIRCAGCLGLAAVAIKGTAEDRRCDHCQRIVPTIYSCQMLLPGYVLPDLLLSSGPTLITFGLCPPCVDSSTPGDIPTKPAGRARPRGQRGQSRGRGRR